MCLNIVLCILHASIEILALAQYLQTNCSQSLAVEIKTLLKTPEISARFRQNGLEPEGTTPQEFEQRVIADIAKWKELVQTNHIKPE